MATESLFSVSPAIKAAYQVGDLTQSAADTAGSLLTENHKYHAFFNERGFHNHEAHAILNLFALGATPNEIAALYHAQEDYQIPAGAADETVVKSLSDPDVFINALGKKPQYQNFLTFFKTAIAKQGWRSVWNEYLFSNDRRSNKLLTLLFDGVLHAFIHVGIGVEFQQPAMVAEGLAMAATTGDSLHGYLMAAEEESSSPGAAKSKTLVEIAQEMRSAPGLSHSGSDMVRFASMYKVDPDNIEAAVRENVNFSGYLAFGAQRSQTHRQYLVNFFLMHSLTSCIGLVPMCDALDTEKAKVRLLEFKARTDLWIYAWQKTPAVDVDYVRSYKPKDQHLTWQEMFKRANALPRDDGHLAKMLRAAAYGSQLCGDGVGAGADADKAWGLTGHDIWLKSAQLGLEGTDYGRGGGLASMIGVDPAKVSQNRL